MSSSARRAPPSLGRRVPPVGRGRESLRTSSQTCSDEKPREKRNPTLAVFLCNFFRPQPRGVVRANKARCQARRRAAREMSCEHGRQRSSCKECGGSSICEHKRRRYFCKDCGGKGICEHGRRRSTCKECGGSGHVIFLEATEVELELEDGEEEPGEGLTTVIAHVVAGPRGGKRKR